MSPRRTKLPLPDSAEHADQAPDAAADGIGREPAPLLVNVRGLSFLLSRSVASLERDEAAGRLPAALKIGASKRWRYAEIVAWVQAGCPCRRAWDAMRGPGG